MLDLLYKSSLVELRKIAESEGIQKSGSVEVLRARMIKEKILSEIDHNQAQALFVSCTSLPVLNIIEKLEKKLNMIVLSSNQALIWETLEKINENKSVTGFGSLFN